MKFRDVWNDRENGISNIIADDVNLLAGGIIKNEEDIDNVRGIAFSPVTTNRIADGAVTTEKIANESVTKEKIASSSIETSLLADDVIAMINLNKFDGYIATIADADGIDNRDNPHNVRIFRVGRDNGKGEGGILIVSGDTNTLYEHHPLEAVEQTYITHDGYVKTRHATNWDGLDGLVFEWSEWESRYLTSEDVQELKAKTGYFSSSLAAGNVDYEIIAYDMTGIFGGLQVEPLSVLVSPDNVGIWESLSIVYADINGVRCKLNRSDFATSDLTANQTNGYTGDKKDWFVYWYIGSDYDFNSEELNTGKYDISMAVPKFKVDEYGNISAKSLKLKYDDRAIQIVNTAEGESIALPDSADAQLRGLKVMGKTEQFTTTGAQLIKYPFAYSNGVEKNGITYTYADSVLSVSGTSTDAGSWFDFNNGVQLPAGDYTLSYVADSEADKKGAKFYVRDADANVVLTELNMGTTTKQKTFTLTEDKSNIRIYMTVTGIVTLKGQIKLQLQSGKTATQFEPYTGGVPAPNVNYPQPLVSVGDDGSVDVHITSGNLMTDWIVGGSRPTDGGIITDNLYRRTDYIPIFSAIGNLVASGLNGKLNTFMAFYDKEKSYISRTSSSASKGSYTTAIPSNAAYVILNVLQTTNNTGTIEADLPVVMLEYGTTPTAYKPYKPIQTLTISTPNGLSGVPVSSGGNYTDASGQQYICDEKDYGNEMYIQRIGHILSYLGEEIDTPYISSTGELSEGAEIYYVLAEPQISQLTAEEVEAYKALNMYYPSTSIHNSENAHMAVNYVADTKNYVDNQIKKEVAELTAAILTQ